MVTRIIAGVAKGTRLQVPPSGTRPTSERAREAIFSHLDSAGVLARARVADIFAGSGALGIEALSRGAERAVFVDNNARAGGVIKKNLQAAKLLGAGRVVKADAQAFLQDVADVFDVVFLDPPYAFADWEDLLGAVREKLHEDSVVVAEHASGPIALPEGLRIYASKRYGDTYVDYLCSDPANC